MLPKSLSNGICSLNPHEDRLTLSVDMEITADGTMVRHEIYESVINSVERLVYDDVSDLIERNDKRIAEKYAHIRDELFMMHNLAVRLSKLRHDREASILTSMKHISHWMRTVYRPASV